MKPVVSAGNAWLCTITSIFAIIILSVLGDLFRRNHEVVMGSVNDPENGKAVARTIFTAVFVYIFFLIFCGCQAWLHTTQKRRGAISI